MSIMQRLTLIGMVNYNPSLFDNLVLPEEYDKNTFIESLLLEHGEKLVLYSDVDFMKYSIGAWGRKWSLELSRIAQALFAEYNPIWNYDRYEEWDDTNAKNHTSTNVNDMDQSSENTSSDGRTVKTDTATDTTNSSNEDIHHTLTNDADYDVITETNDAAEVEHQISADNSSTYQPESKDISDGGKTTVTTDGTKDDITEDTTTQSNAAASDTSTSTTTESGDGYNSNTTHGSGSSKTAEEDNFASHHNAHLYGNVGVTTSASMVTEVIQQRMKYNLYEVATRLFANELLIGIY